MVDSNLLHAEYLERLELIHNIYEILPETEIKRLTIPAIFGRAYDENFISDYLAYILDPKRNGIGVEPLERLISFIAGEDASIELELDSDSVEISREYTLGDHGRIDFLIKFGTNGVLGIENKITAFEGENQTVSYAKGIKHDFDNHDHYLIFLTPTGFLPSSKEFIAVSYGDLHQLLREISFPVLGDIHKVVIWEDFLAHLEGYIIMDEGKIELTEKSRLYLKNYEMLADLRGSYEQDAERIYEYVTASIKSTFGESWTFYFKGRLNSQEITRDSWKLDKFRAFYQFMFSRDLLIKDAYQYMFGIWPRNQQSKQFIDWLKVNRPQIKEICSENDMEAYGPKRGSSSYLIAYKSFPLIIEDIKQIDQQFIQVINEFNVFKPIMDDALITYRNQLEEG